MRRRCDERPLLPRRGGGPAVNVTLAPVPQSEHDDFFAMAEAYFRELDRYDPMAAERGGIEGFRRATLDDAEGRELLWVLADGERAGLAVVRTLPDWPDETRTVASIAEFTVLPAHRRSGVGRAAGGGAAGGAPAARHRAGGGGDPARQRAREGVLGRPRLRGSIDPDRAPPVRYDHAAAPPPPSP